MAGGGGAAGDVPSFADFYRAFNGRPPFPWQERLARHVESAGQWPREIGVQTGLGKTACLEIAVWWLQAQADLEPGQRTAPTRIWWVVNRRLLVDSTWEHARRLQAALDDPAGAGLAGTAADTLSRVGERLRRLAAVPARLPLDVIRLRGGVDSRSPADPSRPTVLLCTLPMYGSRLLFRGYRSASGMRSIDAAMAGTDSLVLLDEAHLAPHLARLMEGLAGCHPHAEAILGEARSRSRITALTATGSAPARRFDLDGDDEAHPVIRQRLHARKPVEVRTPARGDIAAQLADAAAELLDGAARPTSCLVFANQPATARDTFARLQQILSEDDTETLLLTGLSREREAERVRSRILDPATGMPATRSTEHTRERNLVVVATQTLEVGADIDAELLVTEACGVRALTQRLGRLNRLGRHPHARGIYVHLPPGPRGQATGWPVYGEEPERVLERLERACAGSAERIVELPPARVSGVLGSPEDDPGRAPEVLPAILREWTKTTHPPRDAAPVEPYFAGIRGADYSASIIWRVHVPEEDERLWPRARGHEAVEVPLRAVREALEDGEEVARLRPDGVTVESARGPELRPGDEIILPVDRGLLDEFGWNGEARKPVVDVSLAGQGVPLDDGALRRLCGLRLGGQITTALGGEDDDTEPDDRERAVSAILEALRTAATPPGWEDAEWSGLIGSLGDSIEEPRDEVPRIPLRAPQRRRAHSDLASGFDEMSLGAAAAGLAEHGLAVGRLASRIGEQLGLRADLLSAVERAGELHDIGKADERFQRWLDPRRLRRALLAKSDTPRHRWAATRAGAGWPRGGRHEALSGRLARAWLDAASPLETPDEEDLLLHLILSHHGHGRPLVPPVDDDTAARGEAIVAGAAVDAPAQLASADWDQPARFRRLNDRYGPWGLALLEAIVRLADHAASAGVDAGGDASP
ncbi:MAG: type I-U CRISPR-associated helicase/endonuclease Cas3 [Chloroflexi bacterium]|nr:type I-U CRISPR-associated helicase/endonuclease Cas3 [Chloroflexota bacterium]